jgi:putative membrane protein
MIKKLLLESIAVLVVAWIMPRVTINPWYVAVIVAVVLGLINAFIRPLVKLIALPITVLTLGLFSLVINAAMVLLCAKIVPGFKTGGFLSALLFSILLSIVSWAINLVFNRD